MSAVAEVDTLLENVAACPACGSPELRELPVRNLNSRSPERIAQMTEALGGDFFTKQRISICGGCGHVLQTTRPKGESLQRIYDRFAEAVSKVTPTDGNMYEYLLKENPKDYVDMAAKSLEFLDEHGLVEGVRSVLELRTYGGGLLAMLRERGVEHVEGAYIQDFDASLARRVFGIERLDPFSFARPVSDYTPERASYDLIVSYEALTHSLDPVGLLRFVRDHLSERGVAVLLREPNTPAYRPYQPLEVVFNNFHMNLLTPSSIERLVGRAEGLAVEMYDEHHRDYVKPLYLNLVLRRGAPPAVSASPYDEAYYRAWIAEDAAGRRQTVSGVRRRLRRIGEPLGAALRDEIAPAVRARLGR